MPGSLVCSLAFACTVSVVRAARQRNITPSSAGNLHPSRPRLGLSGGGWYAGQGTHATNVPLPACFGGGRPPTAKTGGKG